MVSWSTGPQYECELVDKDLVTFCLQKHNKDMHICKFGKTVSGSFDKN
jgi:hypothetical protein